MFRHCWESLHAVRLAKTILSHQGKGFFSFFDWLVFLLFFKTLYRSTREGNGTPLHYSCLENPMDGGAWKAAVHGVAEGWTRLSNFTFTFTFHFHALEKEMAPHSSTLAWRIPWMEEPGRLQSMGSLRVGHDWATSLSLFTFMHWRRKWQQCSCLENPRDGGAWWAAVYGVTQSRTQLKWLSSSSMHSLWIPFLKMVCFESRNF